MIASLSKTEAVKRTGADGSSFIIIFCLIFLLIYGSIAVIHSYAIIRCCVYEINFITELYYIYNWRINYIPFS
jgi:hypothetical protein